MSHYLSKSNFDSESSSLEFEDDNIFFFVQDPLVVHTPSSIDINLGTMPPIHGEPKLFHWSKKSIRIFTRRISTVQVPTSSATVIFETKTGDNTFTLPSSNTTIDSDSIDDIDFLITFRKGKHTCTFHPIYRFVSYSHLSPFFHVFIFFSLDSYFVSSLY